MDTEKPIEPLKIDYDLWRLFSDAHRLISYASQKELDRYGISHEIVAILSAIYLLGDNIMPIELARKMRRKPQTITEIIRRMELKGLIQKNRDDNKKNMFRISLTKKGLTAFEKASQITVYNDILKIISGERREIFVKCLEEIQAKARTMV